MVCLLHVCSGFSSVLTIILNQDTTKFTDKIDVTSVDEFFHSNAWLGACTAMSGAIGGQLFGLIADRYRILCIYRIVENFRGRKLSRISWF